MREHKFRAVTREVNLIYDIDSIEFFTDGTIIVNGEIPVDALEEWTGLKDKNGRNLDWWEGDRFKHPSGEYVIEWWEGNLFMHGPDGYTPVGDAKDWAVIPKKTGTIHDAPEGKE